MLKIANKLSREFKASIVFVFASFCAQGMNIVSLPFFTRLLSTEQMGIVTTYNTWLNLIGLVTSLGLTSGSFNIAMLKFRDSRSEYMSSALSLSLIPSLFLLTLSFFFSDLFSSWLGLSVPLIKCLCIMLVLNPALNLWLMKQRYEYKYISVFVVTVVNSVFGTIISIVSVLLAADINLSALSEIKIISSSIITGLIAFILSIIILNSGKCFYKIIYWKFALKTGLPLIVHSIAKYILDASDRILIGFFLGASAVGIYGVVYNLSSISLVFWTAINSALIPFMFENIKNKKISVVSNVVITLLFFYAIICVILMLLAPEIVNLLAGSNYSSAVYLVPPIAAGVFFTSLYNLYSNLLLYKERTNYIMCATLSAAVVNVVLNCICIPIFGYIAAAYITLFSCCLLAFMQYLFSSILNISSILNNRINLILSISIIVVSIIINLIYEMPNSVRYCILLLLLVVLFLSRNRIVGAYKSTR